MWQPVDAGYAELLKVLIKQKFSSWLDSDENADRWYGNLEPFSAKGRRMLISHWTGEAYKILISAKYDDFRWRMFEKTGCLITADRSDGEKINPEGLPNYKVCPPFLIDPNVSLPAANYVELDQGQVLWQ